MFRDLQKDVLFSLRIMRKNIVFTLTALATLALGIGAATALFSAVHAVLLRPLPYPGEDRLAMVYSVWKDGSIFWSSEPNVQDLRDQSTLFEGFGAMRYGSLTLLGGKAPQRLTVGLVSAEVFPLLRTKPALGRLFNRDDELPDGPRVGILSHELWQGRFGGDRSIVGSLLELDGRDPIRVIGVLPAGFRMWVPRHTNFPRRVDLWYPYQVDYRNAERDNNNLTVLARLKEGVTWEQAQQEADRIAKPIDEKYYAPRGRGIGFRLVPLRQDTVEEVRPALLTLQAAAGLMLLIACANVANLLLAQGTGRRRELAIRAALGATRGRLIRLSLTQSALLTLAGGLAGVGLAAAAVSLLSAYVPAKLPRLDTVELNGAVLAVTFLASLAAGCFFGTIPALKFVRADDNAALKEGGRTPSQSALPRFRSALIVGEVALSLLLLVAGSLLLRSFFNLQSADPGYEAANLLTFTISLPPSRYGTDAQRTALYRDLQERIRGLPGVESVGGSMLLPFGRSLYIPGFTFHDTDQGQDGRLRLPALARPALPGYFETLRARLVAGRSFNYQDEEGGKLVAVIDETLAQRVWPGENPIGKRLSRRPDSEQPDFREVVGVVENLRLTSLTGERFHQVYLPVSQFPSRTMSYVVRRNRQPEALLPSIRAQVRELDPNIALWEIGRLDHTLREVMAPQRITSLLMAIFAAVGLSLSVVGIYGVVSYSASRRIHEVGVRVALGAVRRDVYRLILGQGLRIVALGIAIGLAASWILAGTIESLLFGVTARDPWSYTLVPLALAAAAMLGCYLPARRSARIDPLAALRHR